MKNDFDSLLNFDFISLSDAKATLSHQLRKTKQKRIAITQHGHPEAVLLSYQDFLALVSQISPKASSSEVIDFIQWDRERKNRAEVSRAISAYFDPAKLSRKGQKPYKKKRVHEYD
ncbi:MAG: type II toxin-antitoxin system Phd/YefM family antitoxin [Deltaproteobacteria bacterium]|nr:type II toxin-antitoxin system Phd/YefM family antitoxin [Deltaproteobacteria bacterium]